ncbi:MAG: group 1 truncated hemoglobin [Thiothrix sp.]|nr:MAG: group 1 truncated hemoglobin [Thiothrix sp.]
MSEQSTLYARLGGYDAISAVVDNLLSRLISDAQLGRFWSSRGDDGIAREKQLLTDYLCSNSGGPVLYTGRGNQVSHHGMGISCEDWSCFIGHLQETLTHFQVPNTERAEVLAFIESTKVDIVE